MDYEAYIGKKGYSILKSKLTIDQQKMIRDDLNVKPYVPGSPINVTESYPVYLESPKKLYLPRFYGIEKFGLPNDNKLSHGDSINIIFKGMPRDYQLKIVDAFFKHINEKLLPGGLLDIPCGFGKCTSKNTPIMMYDGSIKMVQDIKVGDQLMGDDSTPRNVLSLARGREMMYDIIPNKGDKYTVNESHILSLKCSTNHSKKYRKGEIYDISVKDYLNLPKCFHGPAGPLLGFRVPIMFPKKDVDIDPYILGYWLGDGNSDNSAITTEESEVVCYFKEYCEKINCYIIQGRDTDNFRGSLRYSISGKQINNKRTPNVLLNNLRKYNLINNKHIPHDFKCNSRENRLELLAGLIDSDGSLMGNGYDIIQKNEKLLDDIIYLARSLGFAAYKNECKKSCIYKGEKREGTYYRTFIHGKGLEEIPVKCERKKCLPRKQIKDALVTRIKVIKKEEDDYYGFELDGNRRYVLGDFTVTHNTIMALYIIAKLKLKTLVIVHKEFLLNQWIEKINEFLPDAKIGKIQGQIIDIEDKDIVIGMLQSLSMKEYPEDTFDSFGFTILDETHHLAAEVFVRSLQKIVTKYILGLSATMERKDGLTKVFKMFIGDIIYKMKRDKDEGVLIKAVKFVTQDEEFNTVEYDFRGNVKYSTMISKICSFNNRTEMILSIIENELKLNNKQQIIVLGQFKNILTYLYKAIEHRNIGTVGYYIGGMKEEQLKKSELKQIIIATYSMAAEGLDIKTLTTLILATPKTDIEQAVGRILREKHEQPLVIDIVDNHEVFKKQWDKRKAYYLKNNYKILYTKDFIKNNYNDDGIWCEIKKEKKGSTKEKKCLVNFTNLNIN
jgi:superfamily II DNA or RNA helicase